MEKKEILKKIWVTYIMKGEYNLGYIQILPGKKFEIIIWGNWKDSHHLSEVVFSVVI